MKNFLALLAGLWLLTASQSLLAEISLQDLIASGEFSVDAKLVPDKNIVPGQELQLQLIVSTNRWFAGGTRLDIPEMEKMVVVQRESFAVNSSRYYNGQTWGVQTWELSLFPQAAGVFQTPAVALGVKVNHGQFGVVEGEVTAPVFQFTVTAPESTDDLEDWVATTSFKAERRFDRALDGLQVGDALQSTITISGENMLAMMLPEYRLRPVEGLAAYPQQPKLSNQQQRGARIAKRVEVVDYIIEKGGSFVIPEQVFYWWNTSSQSLDMVVLPAVEFKVSGGFWVNLKAFARETEWSRLWWLVAIAAGLFALRALARRYRSAGIVTERRLAGRIRRAVRAGDTVQACRWLYFWLDHFPGEHAEITLRALAAELDDPAFSKQLESLLQTSYSDSRNNSPEAVDVPKIQTGRWQALRDKFKPSPIKLRLEP